MNLGLFELLPGSDDYICISGIDKAVFSDYFTLLEMEQLIKKKTVKDCYSYQRKRYCSAGDCCPFYHRDLTPDICVQFLFGECRNKTGQKKCRNLHVKDSFLPFPPSREVARVRRLQQQTVASIIAAPAIPSSSLSRPGQLRNVKRLLAGKKWLQVRMLKVESCKTFYVRPVDVVEEAFSTIEQVNSFYCSQLSKKLRLPFAKNGQLCAVLCGQTWYRAVVVKDMEEEVEMEGFVLVTLLDDGGVVTVHESKLFQLEEQFQSGTSWSLPCHLARVSSDIMDKDMASEMLNIFLEVEAPQLEVLGSPVLLKSDQFSVPVDIRWEKLAVQDDPFLPLEMEDCSLSAVLVERGLAEYLEEEVGLAEEKVSNSENEKEEEGCNATLSESFMLLQ